MAGHDADIVARGVLERHCAIGKTPLRAFALCKGPDPCHITCCRSYRLHAPDRPQAYAHPARLILILSLAPTVGLGIGRFAYALVLPDMRDSLGWSYSAAGFMNTINAIGYLAGALLASRMIRRFGLSTTIRWATLACLFSLMLCALSGNFWVLSFSRLVIGDAAAAVFVGGAALATTIAQSRPERANFLLSLFYAGPGLGILASGLIAPFVLQAFGPGSWWIVWWALTLLSAAMIIPLMLTPLHSNAAVDHATRTDFVIRPVLIYLTSYFLFGAGYIAYMTFMIAYVRDGGGGAAAQSIFWSLIGISAFATPWVWRGVLALDRGGLATTIILTVNAIGAALPIFGHSPLLLAVSALVFGVAFFAVVGSTTAFVRFNYPPAGWPAGIAAMTIAFGIGQTLGPIVVGAITDAMGSLSIALNVSAAMLAVGAVASAFQRKLSKT
jgi:predicted MFS family arabinose efflux permease